MNLTVLNYKWKILSLQAIIECICFPCVLYQKLGGNAMLVDAEHAFDAAYSKALGVDVENLIVCQPDNGEMALESKIYTLLSVFFFVSRRAILDVILAC